MHYGKFSRKQLICLTWWQMEQFQDRDAIICDGSVRSGKTIAMTVSFVLWSMSQFDGQMFAICGKTIESLRRNVILHLAEWLEGLFTVQERRSENRVTISGMGRKNTYYLFGGKDEGSAALIQGMTLAGVLFDEVALMPQSFVEQATARCSVEGSRFWFNCNPESPSHWFYTEWIKGDQPDKKNALHLHFTMGDNLTLSQKVKQRYEKQYAGVFYDRYIRGAWANADGMVYPDFDPKIHYIPLSQVPLGEITKWFVGVDFGWEHYGVFVLIGKTQDGRYYLVKEWAAKHRHIDQWAEIALAIKEKLGNINFYCDAARPDLVQKLREAGIRAIYARKDVLAGISEVASLYKQRRLFVVRENVKRFPEEIYSYVWKPGADEPVKENDDVQDGIRYAIYSDLKYGR